MAKPKEKSDAGVYHSDAADFYKVYEEHTKTLRAWMVAYGVGAPALMLSNQVLATKILASKDISLIGLTFLAGVSCQVLLALINKYAMWICYRGANSAEFQLTLIYKAARWLSTQFWIDILLDVSAVTLMCFATYRIFINSGIGM